MSKLFDEAVEYFESLEGTLSEEEVTKAAGYMHEMFALGRFKDVTRLWAIAQKDIGVLFSIHPQIEKIAVSSAIQMTEETIKVHPGYVDPNYSKPALFPDGLDEDLGKKRQRE